VKKPEAGFVKAAKVFKGQVSNKSDKLDPGASLDWYSLTVGWAIAMGVNVRKAHDFALYIRYDTDLG
jgi:hypothetical protein